MACVQIQNANPDSEMEEGEIVDDMDDLLDISSEEEFLLRQRLEVLENYSSVLERTKAKQITFGPDNSLKVECTIHKIVRNTKSHHKHKKCEHKKHTGKENGRRKKKNFLRKTFLSETSEDSDDDYRAKRRKLADAVTLNKAKDGSSTLKDRITKMLLCDKTRPNNQLNHTGVTPERRKSTSDIQTCNNIRDNKPHPVQKEISIITIGSSSNSNESNCSISVDQQKDNNSQQKDTSNVGKSYDTISREDNSDEDIELLRQNALQTKSSKSKHAMNDHLHSGSKGEFLSEAEDSDTTELRNICLKSALLKKAYEMKRKKKIKKRLSQSFNLQNDFNMVEDLTSYENFTDIESVDMEIGSDGEEKVKDIIDNNKIFNSDRMLNITKSTKSKEDEFEEDEDLLRAKLLTSLSKNLPILVDNDNNSVQLKQCINKATETINQLKTHPNQATTKTKEESKFIIQLGGSDSEGEHEATKNLTKMHMKLSEQEDFQRKLDMFLKSSRMQVENNITNDGDLLQPSHLLPPPTHILPPPTHLLALSTHILSPPTHLVPPHLQKPSQKIVAKTMNNLPKPEQIEYKNLVKRMAELEKIKLTRQSLGNMENKVNLVKETLKPRNVSNDLVKKSAVDLDEKISASRKKIANASANILQLKDEAKKLAQKYKIVATELRNLRTAMVINKKQQNVAQISLNNIQYQHQLLLKSSRNMNPYKQTQHPINKQVNTTLIAKLQKENHPLLKDIKKPNNLKEVRVSIANDLNTDISRHPRLSVQVDVTKNKKVVIMSKDSTQERLINLKESQRESHNDKSDLTTNSHDDANVNIGDVQKTLDPDIEATQINDYTSPLEALKRESWEEDPNAFLCPFEVGGSCRDPECNHLHPKPPSKR